MAKIVFNPGYSFDSLPVCEAVRFIRQDTLAARIQRLEEEWDTTARLDGLALSELQASVSDLIADFRAICELDN